MQSWQRTIHSVCFCSLMIGLTGCAAWTKQQRPEESLSRTMGNLSASSLSDNNSTAQPNTKQAQIELLMVFAQQDEQRHDYAAAVKKYQDILKLESNLTASHRIAVAWAHLGEHAQADKAMGDCLKAAPDNPEILADAAYLQYLQNHLDEAEKLSRRGLTLDPNLPRLHNNLGLILAQRNLPEAALQEFQLAGCSPQQAFANVGHAYALAGQFDKAQPYLQQASVGPSPDARAAKTQAIIAGRGAVVPASSYSTK